MSSLVTKSTLSYHCLVSDWLPLWFPCTHSTHSGLDVTQDTPVEILHTYLLGIVKYVWYILHSSWTKPQMELFVIRLQSTNIDGLNLPTIRASYMMQYKNNLIGRHFKTLSQTLAFHVHDLSTPEQFTLVKAMGLLGALLWIAEIDDLEQYLVSYL